MSASSKSEHVHAMARSPVNAHGFALLALSFQTLGIIYSDIGTSPLYVLNGIWPSTGPVPSKEDVIGGISAILWSLTLLPLLKYVLICLRFGTHEGEGGTFALFQGLYPPEEKDFDADRTLTGDSAKFSVRQPAKLTSKLRWPLLAWSLLGTSLTLSDGILTPAVSVTSAVSGIAIARPSVSHDIVPISIAFLVPLFLMQFRGTANLSFVFAPVAFVWLALIGATGIVNIIHYPGIFRAFDPSRAIMLFVRTGDYDLLSGVLLAVTGCEALFANLGQFNMLSIQFSFCCFVYPCLCLAYLGQGARLITDGEAVISNIFYQTIPGPANGPLFWILYVFAILATLIASQALITATFSLIQQLMNMHSLPQLRMIYTSDTIQGQVYIPIVNFILMVAVIIFVVAFKSSTSLTNAYGFAVATVMFTTTMLIALQMKFVKGLPAVLAIAFFLSFGFFDGLFWGSALRKVPDGAWVPLMLGLILVVFMLFWTWAKGLEDKFDGRNRMNLRHFILPSDTEEVFLRVGQNQNLQGEVSTESEDDHDVEDEKIQHPSYYILEDHDTGKGVGTGSASGRRELTRIQTCAVFHKLTVGKGVPHSFVGFIRQWPSLPRVVIFLAVRVLPTARVAPEDRYAVTKVRSIQGFYGVTYYLGFRDDFNIKIDEVVDRMCALEARSDPRHSSEAVDEIRCVTRQYTHIVPHYYVVSKRMDAGRISWVVNWVRSVLIEEVYRRLVTMFPEQENWVTSGDEIIRVGVTAEI
ncbi:potassium transporter [Amylocystis lapponica]|nr:potassium transporter [Amylocystis lapponica]